MRDRITTNDGKVFGRGGILDTALKNNDKATLKEIRECVLQFFLKPKTAWEKIQAAKLQAFTTTGDLSTVGTTVWKVFLSEVMVDMNYEKAFDDIPLGDSEGSWEIHDVTDGLTFRKVAEGERLEVCGFTGSKATAYVEKRGGALGVTDEVERFRRVYQLIQNARTFRNRYWENKRDEHYALIAAAAPAGGVRETAYAGAATDTVASRIIQTINAGCAAIGTRCRNKSYDNMNRYVLFLPESFHILGDEVQAILNQPTVLSSSQAEGPVRKKLTYAVDFNYTWSTQIPALNGLLCLPGNKSQMANVVSPFALEDNDILTLTKWFAVWTYYGAAIGDTDQVQRVLFA